MSAKWDELDRYVVISADTHAGADLLDYKAYLPKSLHQQIHYRVDTTLPRTAQTLT